MVFAATEDLDVQIGNRDHSWELFLFDQREGRIRQLTDVPHSPAQNYEVWKPAMDDSGELVAYQGYIAVDPDKRYPYQVFVYDDRNRNIRQITGHSTELPNGICPSLSRDGRTLAFLSDTGLFVGDPAGEDFRRVVDVSAARPQGLGCPKLSGDGKRLVFGALADLDPTVENEDMSAEIFMMNLEDGTILQVTDSEPLLDCDDASCSSGLGAVNDNAEVLAASSSFNSKTVPLPLLISTARIMPLQRLNNPPVLTIPERVEIPVLKTTQVRVEAFDPDGEPVTFVVNRIPWSTYTPLSALAQFTLDDHGDGSADLNFSPTRDDVGRYALRVAAFDERGGVAVKDFELNIADSRP